MEEFCFLKFPNQNVCKVELGNKVLEEQGYRRTRTLVSFVHYYSFSVGAVVKWVFSLNHFESDFSKWFVEIEKKNRIETPTFCEVS